MSNPIMTQYVNTTTSGYVQTQKTSKPATVDYPQFLQLLVAEMRNQDPTDPADPTAHISQLASFSAVEQQVRTNAALGSLLAAQADQIIGKTVATEDGSIRGVVVSVTIADGGLVTATLKDGSRIDLGSGITISMS